MKRKFIQWIRMDLAGLTLLLLQRNAWRNVSLEQAQTIATLRALLEAPGQIVGRSAR